MNTVAEIVEIFSYSQEEQETFAYIREYMNAVAPHLPDLLDTDERRKRFMLAGLFLTYRACNHTGQSMSTDPGSVRLPDIDLTRLKQFREKTGCKINSTEDYLKMLGASRLSLLFRRPASILIGFVLG